ncbi:MAG: ATP-binding protein [Bacteroidetes bacterium]|nr:ATP-binding protein [Bacteroidota bacterium]
MSSGTASVLWVVLAGTITLLLLTISLVLSLIVAKQRELKLKEQQIQELERSERRYRGIFENALAGIVRFTYPGFELLEANNAAMQMFRVENSFEIPSIFRDILNNNTQLKKTLNEQGHIDSYQTRVRRKDGKEIWIVFSASVYLPENYMEVVMIDVTEKKRLEERQLRTERIESIGVFASGLAHDLQNMLVPLKLSVDLLERRLSAEDVRTVAYTIREGIENGLEMVRNMLAFVRGAEGKHVPIEMCDFVRRFVRSTQEHLPKGIHLSVVYTVQPLHTHGDPIQLRQVFTNLIQNACDAMPNGGSINIILERCVLDTQSADGILNGYPGSFIKCSVSDTGCGIPQEHLHKIFDPFFTTKEVGKGTGLGLAIVAGIVKGHRGFIHVESTPGEGTIFSLYIPTFETIEVQ